MDKITVGIPRSLFYYYYGKKWIYYLECLNIDYIISPKTNKEIIQMGEDIANDEMCLSFKTYLGHIAYLDDKCDYILVPRIDNFGLTNQTCTNFLSAFDIVNNLFGTKILNYNINEQNNEDERLGFYKMGKILRKSKKECTKAYNLAIKKEYNYNYANERLNLKKLDSSKLKILLVGHPYNIYDNCIGMPIIKYLEHLDCEIIYCNKINSKKTDLLSYYYSKNLYWKYSKENIGAIKLCENRIDGVVFITTFPCGLDSLVNELVMRKLELPYLNLVLDSLTANAGIETRLESFIDILLQRRVNNG